MNLHRKLHELVAEPLAGAGPGVGEGNALRPIGVAGEGAQLFQFRDGAFGIEWIHGWPILTSGIGGGRSWVRFFNSLVELSASSACRFRWVRFFETRARTGW